MKLVFTINTHTHRHKQISEIYSTQGFTYVYVYVCACVYNMQPFCVRSNWLGIFALFSYEDF